MSNIKGGQDLTSSRKLTLRPDQGYRVIFPGIFSGDVMKTLGGYGYCLMASCPRINAFNYILLGISEQSGQIIQVFRDIEFDGFILLNITNVHYLKFESLAHPGTENQPRAIHRVSKGQIKRKIISTGVSLISGKEDKSLIFSFFDL